MKKIITHLKIEEGFTLIEMSLVLFIISALLLLFVPNLSDRQESAASTGDDAVASVLQAQVDMYKMDHDNKAPASFDAMRNAKYLTEKQAKKAAADFELSGDTVVRKTTTNSQ
ncbi:MAG: competence type IV pilus major pilin ComGC [Alkalibacterium sp.]